MNPKFFQGQEFDLNKIHVKRNQYLPIPLQSGATNQVLNTTIFISFAPINLTKIHSTNSLVALISASNMLYAVCSCLVHDHEIGPAERKIM